MYVHVSLADENSIGVYSTLTHLTKRLVPGLILFLISAVPKASYVDS
jgi:hypothetical protein